jgi:hypothetical protein
MAQTLKFGNGTWATKKDSILAYNDENENYKPLPFNYTGAGKGTRVNKEGLIEVVENDRPRIDYLDSEDGVFLLEKAATNLITYSEAFDNAYWTKSGASVTSGFVSPDGTANAFKLIEDSTNAFHGFYQNANISLPIGKITMSIFVKVNGRDYFQLRTGSAAGVTGAPLYANFDLNNNSVTASSSGVDNAKISSFNNNWKRISISFTVTSVSQASLVFQPITTSSAVIGETYQGDGTSGIYVWGTQLESGDLSSYIPTQGSIQTRVQETASGSGNSEVFNDSEGVLFADIAALADDNTSRRISISDGSSNPNNLVCVDMSEYTNTIIGRIRTSNSEVAFLQSTSQKQTQKNKIAVKYKVNNFALWINGFEVDTENNGAVPIGLNDVSFDRGNGSNDFYGKTKELAYYDTVLTDLELETITSYRTWLSMVNELNLNVIYNG